MDTKQLISEAKMRFNHNSAKSYLKDKYDSKLSVATQGGLWKATPTLIAVLSAYDDESIVLIDEYNNPISVNRPVLLKTIKETYKTVMEAWATEWAILEKKR